jgi:hypothetical protein
MSGMAQSITARSKGWPARSTRWIASRPPPAHDVSKPALVVPDQRALRGGVLAVGGRLDRDGIGRRQVDLHGGAGARRGDGRDDTAVLPHEPVDNRRAQAGSRLTLGGEKRIEHAGGGLFVHTHALIAHLDEDVAVVARAQWGGVGEDVGTPRAHGDAAAVRHGVAGVDGEVEEDLLELTSIADDAQVRGRGGLEDDLLGQGAREHGGDVADDVGEAQGAAHAGGGAADGQQLA